MSAALERFAAGGEILAPREQGPGNQFCYMRAPFGTPIEFISYPSRQPYTETASLRRWKPGPAGRK
jgi:hypothetical protein